MTCTSKIYQSIANSCTQRKGIEPIMYWAYRSNVDFVFSDNTITSVDSVPLGVIEAHKFGLNVGHDLVVIEDQPDRFIQKFTAIINENSAVVDKMDDIVAFVKENGSTTWSVYGAKHGLWKTSQSQMINDNRAVIAVEFASREGMEEEYDKYITSVDIAAFPNMNDYDLIYGGIIANGGAVELTINSDKTGYIKLPNGSKFTTNSGVISLTYSGVAGAITYYTPKTNTDTNIDNSDVAGSLTRNADAAFSFAGCMNITELISNEGEFFNFGGSDNFENLIAPKATTIYGSGCKLTAKSIGDILINVHETRPTITGYFDFSGANNALKTTIESYIIAQGYSLPGDDVIDWFGNDCPNVTLTLRTS